MQKLIAKIFLIIICLSINITPGEYSMNSQNESFSLEKFLNKIENFESNEEKDEFIKKFILKNKGSFPLLENDTTAVFFYYGNTDSAGVIGDNTFWAETKYMQRVEGTSLFYLKENFESDARIEYWLMFGKDSFPSIDSLNQYIVLNGFGQISELAMPDYKRHEYFTNYIHGEKGEFDFLKHHNIPSKYLNYPHDIHVYLPPGYSETIDYPVVYLQDGYDYVEFAATPYVLNRLIEENKIEPLIAVFITPPNRFEPKFPNRMTEYGMNDDYVKFFVHELVPFIDNNYSTKKDKDARLVGGASYGGLISFYIGFSHPEIFGKAYSQSGYHSFQKNRMINLVKESEVKDFSVYIDVGTYEKIVGANLLPEGERDFLQGNRDMNKALQEKGYDFVYREYPEGHTWGNWRRYLIDALIYFFGE